MLHKNVIEKKGFRSLDSQEIEAVAGGNVIVVTGSSPHAGTTSSGAGNPGFAHGDGAGGLSGGNPFYSLNIFTGLDVEAIAALSQQNSDSAAADAEIKGEVIDVVADRPSSDVDAREEAFRLTVEQFIKNPIIVEAIVQIRNSLVNALSLENKQEMAEAMDEIEQDIAETMFPPTNSHTGDNTDPINTFRGMMGFPTTPSFPQGGESR